MNVLYKISVDGEWVSNARSLDDIQTFINNYNANNTTVRGFSKRNISRGFRTSTEFTRGPIKIKKLTSSTRLRRRFGTYMDSRETRIIPIPEEVAIIYREPIDIFEDVAGVENDEFRRVINNVNTVLNRFSENDKQNKHFQVVMSYYDGDTLQISSTTFQSFNTVMGSFTELLERLREHYAGLTIKSISLNTMNRVFQTVAGTLVTGGRGKNYRFLLDYLINIFSNQQSSVNTIKKTQTLLDKYHIVSPTTIYNCFIKAVLMSYYKVNIDTELNNTKINNKAKWIIETHKLSILERRIDLWANALAEILSVNIVVTRLTDFKQFGCLLDPDFERIDVLLFGSHSYGLIPKEYEIDNMLQDEITFTRSPSGKIEKLTLKGKDSLVKYKPTEIKGDEWKITCFDLETLNGDKLSRQDNRIDLKHYETDCYAVGYFDGKTYKDFFLMNHLTEGRSTIIEDFIDYLTTKSPLKQVCYSHNGGKFDLWIIFHKLLESKGSVTNVLVKDGRIINMKYTRKKSNGRIYEIFFRDSVVLMAGSLAELCDSFKTKTKKLQGDVDHDIITVDNCKTQWCIDYVKEYLKYDNLSLHELLITFDSIITDLTDYEFGIKDALTAAGITRKIFLSQEYNVEKTPLYNLNDRQDSILREFYYGGRNECFEKLGEFEMPLWYLDFTSLYPTECLRDLPYGKLTEININDLCLNDLTDLDKVKIGGTSFSDIFGFIECKVKHISKTKKPYHALKKDGKLLFSYFDNWTRLVITTDELKYSLEHKLGYQYQITRYFKSKKAPFLKDLIDRIYKVKLDAEKKKNPALRATAKVIINSAYGFWGIRRETENVELVNSKSFKEGNAIPSVLRKLNNYLEAGKLKNFQSTGDYSFFQYKDRLKCQGSNVGISFFIAAYARTRLYELMSDIEQTGGRFYYCDTDSIITDLNIESHPTLKLKYINQNDENPLGNLTNETDEAQGYYTKFISLGNKTYLLQNDNLKKKSKRLVLKFKGLQVKKKYDFWDIDEENKIIIYRDQRMNGKYMIDDIDFKMMNDGYTLKIESMTFQSGLQCIFKEHGVRKCINNKSFRKNYLKADWDENTDQLETFSI